MFGKKTVNSDKIDSLIGKNMTVEGKISSEGSLRIEGTLKGEVEAKGDVFVGETGKVYGDMAVNNLMIAGEIIGNVQVAGRVEITRTGRLDGDLGTQTLVVAEGAQYQGRCFMGSSAQGSFGQEKEPDGVVDLKKRNTIGAKK